MLAATLGGAILRVAQETDDVIGKELAVEEERWDGFAVLLEEQFAELIEQAGEICPQPRCPLEDTGVGGGQEAHEKVRCADAVPVGGPSVSQCLAQHSRGWLVEEVGAETPTGQENVVHVSTRFRRGVWGNRVRLRNDPQSRFAVIMLRRGRPARHGLASLDTFSLLDFPLSPTMNRARPKSVAIALWSPVMRGVLSGLILLCAASLAVLSARSDEPTAGEAIVTDVDGKDHTLLKVKFAAGTRRLTWLADPEGMTEDAKRGPLAIEFRESTSAMPLAQGIITYIPVSSLESARYDLENDRVSLGIKGLSNPLTGPLFYPRVNVLGMSGTDDGKVATFTGGVRGKSAVKSVAFGGAQPYARSKGGATWNIQIVKTKKDEPKVADSPTLTARNLKALYSFPGGVERLAGGIATRKGQPLSFDDKLKRFEMLANDLNTNVAAAEIEPAAGQSASSPYRS